MTETRELKLIFNEQSRPEFQEGFHIEVWCDGRSYDPSTESYHPQYSYTITGSGWQYTGNDISGGANQSPDLLAGMKSLIAFLLASQEGLPEDTEGKSENAEMFPLHVRGFAYLMKEQLEMNYMLLEKESEDNKNAGTS